MKQLADIAYVIPATVFIGYWIGHYLEKKHGGSYLTNAILISTALGFILTIFRIKKYIELQNAKDQKEKPKENRTLKDL